MAISCTDIEEDRDGNFWVATNAGLDKFDPQRERFVRFEHDPVNANSPASADVFRILRDDDGTMWLGTSFQIFNQAVEIGSDDSPNFMAGGFGPSLLAAGKGVVPLHASQSLRGLAPVFGC